MILSKNEAVNWIRTRNAAFWEIFYKDDKESCANYRVEGGNIEDSLTFLEEILDSLPSGDFRIRTRRKMTDPNSSIMKEDFRIISEKSIPQSPVIPQYQENSKQSNIWEERMKYALELKDKEYENKELRREITDIKSSFDKLRLEILDFEDYVKEQLEVLSSPKSGVNSEMKNMLKGGLQSAMEQGSNHVINRFAGMKSSLS